MPSRCFGDSSEADGNGIGLKRSETPYGEHLSKNGVMVVAVGKVLPSCWRYLLRTLYFEINVCVFLS